MPMPIPIPFAVRSGSIQFVPVRFTARGMKIAIFGATGRTGRVTLGLALEQGTGHPKNGHGTPQKWARGSQIWESLGGLGMLKSGMEEPQKWNRTPQKRVQGTPKMGTGTPEFGGIWGDLGPQKAGTEGLQNGHGGPKMGTGTPKFGGIGDPKKREWSYPKNWEQGDPKMGTRDPKNGHGDPKIGGVQGRFGIPKMGTDVLKLGEFLEGLRIPKGERGTPK